MSTYATPPKLRSFVDQRPGPTDMFRNNPRAAAYTDHFAQAGDLLPDVKHKANSYVDHYARPGDLVQQ